MYKIYPQVTQVPELFKLFAYWHKLNQLGLYYITLVSRSDISQGQFLWNLIDVMPGRKFAL